MKSLISLKAKEDKQIKIEFQRLKLINQEKIDLLEKEREELGEQLAKVNII